MLNRNKTGLIVVDIQGKLARLVDNSDSMIANCAALIQGAKALSLPVICLEQNPEKLGATVDELAPLLADCVKITKFTFDGCGEPQFVDEINKHDVDTWLVCGIESHICVYQTARSLKRKGYNVQLAIDCIASRDPDNKALAITKLMAAGVETTCVEMCLYELLKDCRDSAFKTILSLVK